MTAKQKRDATRANARRLYVYNGLPQNDIARLCSVSEKTISKWKIEGEWDKHRATAITSKEQQLTRLYAALNRITAGWEKRAEGEQVPTAAEADSVNKLTAAIQKLEGDAGLSVKVSAYMDALTWMRTRDVKAAQRFSELIDEYIHGLLK